MAFILNKYFDISIFDIVSVSYYIFILIMKFINVVFGGLGLILVAFSRDFQLQTVGGCMIVGSLFYDTKFLKKTCGGCNKAE